MVATIATAESAPPQRVRVVFSGLVLVMLLAALDSTIVATALPTIVTELGGLDHLSWVVTAYLLAQTIVAPLYGKLGDLYGRKGILQGATVLFLAGSALCGASQNLTQLIVFRAIQGLGGGGLMVISQAVVGDVIPPRDRGRYQGIFGAVFGVASIAGPLLGGFFTTHLSWRWIFYINLPVGAIALIVLAVALPSRTERIRRSIDYAGAALLAVALSGMVLITDVGGSMYPWTSSVILAMLAVTIASVIGFLGVERVAAEPVLPLRLFANRAFTVGAVVSFIVGFALFGSVTYLPLFLQVAKGESPTASGLRMMPMMLGMLATSVASGQIISRRGQYHRFPVAGMLVASFGLFLMSRMTVATSALTSSVYMLILGLGLGMVMQVLVIAVQNSVDYGELGVATSGVTLFRLIGGSFGTAAMGAIFANRLAAALPHMSKVSAYTTALSTVFIVGTGTALAGFGLALLLPQTPLRETVAAISAAEIGEAFAMPSDLDSSTELQRALSLLADRDRRQDHMQKIVDRAGVELSAAAAWQLMRIERDPATHPAALARDYGLNADVLEKGVEELRARGLIVESGQPGQPRRSLTREGCEVHDRLSDARRARLAELFSEWPAERHEELARIADRMARELVPPSGPREAA